MSLIARTVAYATVCAGVVLVLVTDRLLSWAGLAVGGAALYQVSTVLRGYLGLLGAASHLFVIHYEEPTLLRRYGEEYRVYCRRVRRWAPRRIA